MPRSALIGAVAANARKLLKPHDRWGDAIVGRHVVRQSQVYPNGERPIRMVRLARGCPEGFVVWRALLPEPTRPRQQVIGEGREPMAPCQERLSASL